MMTYHSDKKCPECLGTGRVVLEYTAGGPSWQEVREREQECAECNGWGLQDEENL
jgi:DnaJ-class molecular chaperone